MTLLDAVLLVNAVVGLLCAVCLLWPRCES